MQEKILIADDDFTQRDLYVELFRQNKFEVISADDGADAWEKIQKDPPKLVFTGISMPRMTGFQLVEMMRKNELFKNIPVIIFSHLGRVEDRKRALEFNNTEFMVKGFNSPNEILKRTKELLNTKNPA